MYGVVRGLLGGCEGFVYILFVFTCHLLLVVGFVYMCMYTHADTCSTCIHIHTHYIHKCTHAAVTHTHTNTHPHPHAARTHTLHIYTLYTHTHTPHLCTHTTYTYTYTHTQHIHKHYTRTHTNTHTHRLLRLYCIHTRRYMLNMYIHACTLYIYTCIHTASCASICRICASDSPYLRETVIVKTVVKTVRQ
jgi:hypothetical protein